MKQPLLRRRSVLAWATALPVTLGAAGLAQGQTTPAAPRPFDLQGHRGARGLAPENTLAAFERALQVGVSTLELDIGLTADGVPVVTHDPALNPALTRDASGAYLQGPGPAVHTLSLAQLQRHDVGRLDPASKYGQQFASQTPRHGERIPTLRALFEYTQAHAPASLRFNIEAKTDPTLPESTAPVEALVGAILDEVRRAGLESRVTLQSFDWRAQALATQQAPGLSRAWLSSPRTLRDPRWTRGLRVEDFGGSTPRLVQAAASDGRGPAIWSPAFADLSSEQVREAQALGLQVVPWTVNQPADLARVMDLGVDGIITDYPDRLRALMATRGMPLPPQVRP
ncbi:glycerophosphodiester phosphodiesterase [Xenophilus arseniciresistens]|uniref:Glycerophosphodiester phosphodiesterase n=1 Tax=Xenophilus arseniciresistens TaxID=1283306 RepID=A0AAE3NA30_9BURK|nr:glycerophosphodiester phosphodiesterase [Xenophilus arseniciresistens]MDA7417369.1 glycerophosphodiester phosphodiesterase [Xenophilus arseniciresistens]